MHAVTLHWTTEGGWNTSPTALEPAPSLLLYFAASGLVAPGAAPLEELRSAHPDAVLIGCTTAGEICGAAVSDGGCSVLAIHFAHTRVRGLCVPVTSAADSAEAGAALAAALSAPDLRHVLVFSDGLLVNGSALTGALRAGLPVGVHATGGLAGDGADFRATAVVMGDRVGAGRVAAVGFYGEHLRVAHGSAGGWTAFGPKRVITRSTGNVVHELDGQPALVLYKRYLGERAAELPASGLLFPLELLQSPDASRGLVRTILAIDEATQSLTFAGDMPTGHYARLMRAGCEALVDGADLAASNASGLNGSRAAILVSCVGRKLVLGQRVEEEVEAVLARLGEGVAAAGFYSYGEIAPSDPGDCCDLHNQTMTLTVLGEVEAAAP